MKSWRTPPVGWPLMGDVDVKSRYRPSGEKAAPSTSVGAAAPPGRYPCGLTSPSAANAATGARAMAQAARPIVLRRGMGDQATKRPGAPGRPRARATSRPHAAGRTS